MGKKRFKEDFLGRERIPRLLVKLSLPALTGMMVMATYNLADTIFVGRSVGPDGIAALTIAFPVQMIISSLAMSIGVGGASVVSRALGAKDKAKANLSGGNILGSAFATGILITTLGSLFLDPILFAFGASETILPLAREYLGIVILSAPMLSIAMSGNNIMRAEGNARMAMVTMMIASGINLALDPVFIFGLDMGIRGAALATVIAHISVASFMIYYFSADRSSLKLKVRDFKPQFKLLREIGAIGSSSFARQASGSLVAVFLNHSIGHYGGDQAIAAYGMIARVMMFSFMPVVGIAQGFQPIAGYNYGAGNLARVRQALKLSLITSVSIGLISFLLLLLFPELILSVFTTDSRLLRVSVNAVGKIILAFPLVGFQIIGASLFQALGRAVPALILALSRQLLFFIPVLFILPPVMGLNGIWYAFPAADVLAFTVTTYMLTRELKTIGHRDYETN
jgi:putative MATE family efflux protein